MSRINCVYLFYIFCIFFVYMILFKNTKLIFMKLFIVESPAKAKTIGKYLGDDYVVKSSVGHVRDLPKSNKKAIDIEAGFVPHYEVDPKKIPVIAYVQNESEESIKMLQGTGCIIERDLTTALYKSFWLLAENE